MAHTDTLERPTAHAQLALDQARASLIALCDGINNEAAVAALIHIAAATREDLEKWQKAARARLIKEKAANVETWRRFPEHGAALQERNDKIDATIREIVQAGIGTRSDKGTRENWGRLPTETTRTTIQGFQAARWRAYNGHCTSARIVADKGRLKIEIGGYAGTCADTPKAIDTMIKRIQAARVSILRYYEEEAVRAAKEICSALREDTGAVQILPDVHDILRGVYTGQTPTIDDEYVRFDIRRAFDIPHDKAREAADALRVFIEKMEALKA